ncbi:Chorismate mutase [Penicillium fimorum]|uniref:Chorismate mutase n=1 Tax=Penicillium fimorum TaxID=1882269 RepID=A0A9W9XZL6_9EURO|nr:Chorismate mutase [Penicillium fimorum]
MHFLLFGFLILPAIATANTDACYGSNVILAPSADHRPVPWGTPSIHFSLNGIPTTCCDSIEEIRTALDDIDDEILGLLNRRAAYVREATRFKSTRESVNVPSRNEAVLKRAEQQAVDIGVPVTIVRATIGAILNSSVPFEQCIVSNLGVLIRFEADSPV